MSEDYRQLTIFDWIPEQNELDDIPEETMVERIGAAIGVKFKKDGKFRDWEAKIGKITISLQYEYYAEGVFDGKKHIGVDVNATHDGCGSTCDSIGEAIDYLRYAIPHIQDCIDRRRNNE